MKLSHSRIFGECCCVLVTHFVLSSLKELVLETDHLPRPQVHIHRTDVAARRQRRAGPGAAVQPSQKNWSWHYGLYIEGQAVGWAIGLHESRLLSPSCLAARNFTQLGKSYCFNLRLYSKKAGVRWGRALNLSRDIGLSINCHRL